MSDGGVSDGGVGDGRVGARRRPTAPPVVGLVLAAGAGRRMGRPKALVREPGGGPAWVSRTVAVCAAGGCDRVVVVVGAEAPAVRAALARDAVDLPAVGRARVVAAADWVEGLGASLRSGLRSLLAPDGADGAEPVAALVMLVDTPDVGVQVVDRVCAVATDAEVLARAAYRGVPGHPVLLGREHWLPAAEQARGDRGARDYLRSRSVRLVECADLADGGDVDTAEALAALGHHPAPGDADPAD